LLIGALSSLGQQAQEQEDSMWTDTQAKFYFFFFVECGKISVGLVSLIALMSDSTHILLIQISLCSIFFVNFSFFLYV
jgi:hypothetical protein